MQLVFLTYLQRSGSTYLANLLDQYEGIGSTLATNFPDGLLKPEVAIETPDDIHAALAQLYSDPKFASWNLARADLQERLKGAKFPVHFPQLLRIMLDLYFTEKQVAVAVIKRGGYIFHLEGLRKMFPDCKVLHLWRDPRAVYASQKRSISTNTTRPMSQTPIKPAILYNRASAMAVKYSHAPWFFSIRFEDLIESQQTTLEKVFEFLGIEPMQRKEIATPYADAIPPEQKHLHINVKSTPQRDRITGWEKELHDIEVYVVQKLCAGTLAEHKYTGHGIQTPLHRCVCGFVWFGAKEVLHFLRSRVFGNRERRC